MGQFDHYVGSIVIVLIFKPFEQHHAEDRSK